MVASKVTLTIGFVAVLATGALAQDYIFTNFQSGYVDHVLPASPCQVMDSVVPVVYNHSIWMVYTCFDGRVIARRHIHPNDGAREPVTVQTGALPLATYTVAAPLPQPPADPSGGQESYCAAQHMVRSVYGGCVPADHPYAAKQ